jgi:hypothetical protein
MWDIYSRQYTSTIDDISSQALQIEAGKIEIVCA